jgi:hypothetical protein
LTDSSRSAVFHQLVLIALLGWVLRAAVALISLRLSTGDEVFQYLEQAHRLVYGYGVVPWEYRFGIRNWLLPGALTGLLFALKAIGLDQPTSYVPAVRVVFATISTSLIFANFMIARQLFNVGAAVIAALLTAIWFDLLYFAPFATPDTLGAYALVWALALILRARPAALIAGLLLGLSVGLRVQYALPAASVGLVVIALHGFRPALVVATSACLVLAALGLLDAWTWGAPFASYYLNFYYNIAAGVSSMFIILPPYWYVTNFIRISLGVYAFATLYGIYDFRRCWPILLVILAVVGSHSLIGHKEYRFVFLAVPLFIVLAAGAISELEKNLTAVKPRWVAGVALGCVAAVSVYGVFKTNVFGRQDRLAAAIELSRRPDVRAVLDLSGVWWSSGGMYYMHWDVPLYFENQVAGIRDEDLQAIATHAVVPAERGPIPGFQTIKAIGNLRILERVSPDAPLQSIPSDTRAPRQQGVDGTFLPQVTPRL